MDEWIYVAATFALTWAVLAIYVVYLGQRGRRASAALREIERAPRQDRGRR